MAQDLIQLCVQVPAQQDQNWMRALRIGYLRACVFYSDDDRDGSIGFAETSQPSGPKGLLGLYVQGESTSTTSPIRQDVFDSACSDTLTEKKNMTLLFQAGSGTHPERAISLAFRMNDHVYWPPYTFCVIMRSAIHCAHSLNVESAQVLKMHCKKNTYVTSRSADPDLMIAAVFAGIPTRDSSVNVLSTAAMLLMQAEANMTRTAAATIVAEKTGLPLGRVHGLDWLQVLTLGEDGQDVSAVDTGLVSFPLVFGAPPLCTGRVSDGWWQ